MRWPLVLVVALLLAACGVPKEQYLEQVEQARKMEGYNVALANRLAEVKKSGEDAKAELSATKTRLDAAEQELSATRSELKTTTGQLAAARGELSEARDKLALKARDAEKLAAENAAAERSLADTNRLVGQLQGRNDVLAKELAAYKEAQGKSARALEEKFVEQQKAAAQEQADLKMQLGEAQAQGREAAKALEVGSKAQAEALAARDARIKALEEARAGREARIGELEARLAAAEADRALLAEQKARAEKDREQKVDELSRTYDGLLKNMEEDLKKGNVTITKLKGQLSVKLLDAILFPSGSAEVKKEGRKVLDSVAKALSEASDQYIVIEGHTDNVPLGGELAQKFPTNWELSAARAVNVVRYLSEKAKVEPSRLAAEGFGEFRPVGGNDTPEGRELNRRIEIKLVPMPKAIEEPSK